MLLNKTLIFRDDKGISLIRALYRLCSTLFYHDRLFEYVSIISLGYICPTIVVSNKRSLLLSLNYVKQNRLRDTFGNENKMALPPIVTSMLPGTTIKGEGFYVELF